MTVEVVEHSDPADFLEVAGSLLCRAEAINNLQLGLARGLGEGRRYGSEPAHMVTFARRGVVFATAFRTPPWHLLLSPVDRTQDVDFMANWMVDEDQRLPGVNAVASVADRFAQTYGRSAGCIPRIAMRHRVFQLDEVTMPASPGGRMRIARGDELEWVREMYEGFHDEANPESSHRLDPGPLFKQGKIWVWEDQAGVPRCLAARNRELPHGACIGPVYTPPECRGRGFASALVARLSQSILDEGEGYFACLFTDLQNPTSNAIYQRIGYRALADVNMWDFDSES